jgi:hypothetical protein
MANALDAFSTREISIAVWAAAFFVWATAKPDIRRSFGNVIRAAAHWKIIALVLFVVAYAAAEVALLYVIGFWRLDLLKNTIIWLLFSGLALAISGITGSGVVDWRRFIRDQVKAVLLVEYVVNTYTFALWIELLLVPLLTGVVLLDAVAKIDKKTALVGKLTTALLAFLGIGVLIFACHKALSVREGVNVVAAVRQIALAPILSVLLFPLVYVFALLSAYEQLFLRLKLGATKKSPTVIRYARWSLFRRLGVDLTAVRDFSRHQGLALMHVETIQDVNRLLSRYCGSTAERAEESAR